MSFFKELKEDIVQSVNELGDSLEEQVTNAEETAESGDVLENEVQSEIHSILEEGSLLDDLPNMEGLSDEKPEEENSEQNEDKIEELLKKDTEEKTENSVKDEAVEEETVEVKAAENQEEETMSKKDEKKNQEEEIMKEEAMKDEVMGSERMENDDLNNEETTVITKGTTINGGIKSDTSLIVKGVIEGDVECLGKLTITGRVAGNSTASEIYVNTPKLTGNLVSRGSVKVDVGTVVVGSISSASVVVAGAVKGDIDVNGPVIVDSTAVVQGSILGKSIQINSGAVIDGMCSLKYADVNLEALFE